jgi:hypothetical protein
MKQASGCLQTQTVTNSDQQHLDKGILRMLAFLLLEDSEGKGDIFIECSFTISS